MNPTIKTDDLPDRRQIEIYRGMSPQDKLRAFQRLYWQAWAVKKAGLKMNHPDWSEEQLEAKVRQIFIRSVT